MTYTPTEQANIDTIHKLFDAEAAADWDAYFALWAEDCVLHIVGQPVIRDKAAYRAFVEAGQSAVGDAFSEFRHTILDLNAEGEDVVFRWRFHPTVRATGNEVSWEGIHWMKVRDGLIHEDWNYADPAEVQRVLAGVMEAKT
jgi:ketosteroid isomerase-like protein